MRNVLQRIKCFHKTLGFRKIGKNKFFKRNSLNVSNFPANYNTWHRFLQHNSFLKNLRFLTNMKRFIFIAHSYCFNAKHLMRFYFLFFQFSSTLDTKRFFERHIFWIFFVFEKGEKIGVGPQPTYQFSMQETKHFSPMFLKK